MHRVRHRDGHVIVTLCCARVVGNGTGRVLHGDIHFANSPFRLRIPLPYRSLGSIISNKVSFCLALLWHFPFRCDSETHNRCCIRYPGIPDTVIQLPSYILAVCGALLLALYHTRVDGFNVLSWRNYSADVSKYLLRNYLVLFFAILL